ncbi:hypothetical protein A2422_02715 [Candidatus Woesebacteria bacterium RIFOXYC1_FULL_31_51]|uniref:Nudix hydrolase domain-containing protein n=1 Tax=Candidatus Woesebacteria bacterium GW2011_GWC2_31_9 TaxID=1618586 RepID=A0A0F9YIE9_9BACT|nr:MAG: hypothetical protein UR17_C0001G0047 [Candidatus Woesebacteria bacterium GW2011_GWF1_31_35]KKP23455.1 MAG: hypothetical protein UR11_C0001G0429 [Candidatus Woesebacteria bacterium GW2011_GWC1_30_29]KKP26432.1 MAG: hypothetical protein UR13_C0004G0046 [Candidatus Woesebacteria bacterium GW2011_GWD1_31_12]KKP27731.1 MAG: hypothetical protein UR16_C0002G0061 [Candidatus Woesebacteria bacterium GW2011_GWB1_31_29]KKP31138.1 MAG: hypothetical protein UR21_C0015G0012 [Candidatus Woesebacteria 
MVEVKLPIEKYSSENRKTISIEPNFKIGEVSYYDVLPSEPIERPRQTLLPVTLIKDWINDFIDNHNSENEKKKGIGWNIDNSGLKNPNFGSVQHYAVVEYDTEGNLINYLNDGLLWQDGKLDTRTGIATPGSLVAPIEKINDDYYVHCFWQWRPAAWDAKIIIPDNLTDPKEIEEYKALKTGMWFLTVPGGFAQFVGDTTEDVAKREAMEEAGIAIDKPVFDKKSFNRASVASLVGVGFSKFERVGDEIKQEGEKLFGKMAVRIDVFRTPDAMVAESVNFAREELGLIRSGK